MIISDAGARSVAAAPCFLQSHAGLDLWGWPDHRTSWRSGFGKERGEGSQLCVLAHPSSRVAPRAGCKLVQFRAAIRCTLSFASGHVRSPWVGGKQPKRRKTCHSLHPSKACWALPQHAQGLSCGKPDWDFHPQEKCTTSPALCFYRPDPWKNPSVTPVAGQGCAAVWLQAVSLPLLACGSPCAAGLLPLPRWELQSHGTLHSAATLGIQLQPLASRAHTHSPGWLPFTENRRSDERLQGHVLPVPGITWSAICFAYGTPGGPSGNFSLLTGNGKGCCVMGTALASANTQCILHSSVQQILMASNHILNKPGI